MQKSMWWYFNAYTTVTTVTIRPRQVTNEGLLVARVPLSTRVYSRELTAMLGVYISPNPIPDSPTMMYGIRAALSTRFPFVTLNRRWLITNEDFPQG